ncbi:MAG TPA: GNAT family N-acetyltransferase [Gemmataceae bacterium]|nr:GNAT family N-acetyltransferase [Gemmataceae bacterium]
MKESPLEFCQVAGRHERPLAAFFQDLRAHGDERWFHPHPLSAEHAARLATYQGRDLYYVATRGEAVLAYGLLRGWDEGYDVPSLGIATHPDARGCGLARPFMLFLHAAARQRGARRVRLKVYPDNTPARRLYESLGYRLESGADGQLVGFCLLETSHG